MAMTVRFAEDPDMFIIPFVVGGLAAPAQLNSRSVPSAENCHFLFVGGAEWCDAHQGSAHHPNRKQLVGKVSAAK
jgi:hypothetical protein